jgi:alkylation response protein AidB-like acyl-CoA dehydrogenase
MLTALNKDLKPFEELITSFSKGELKPHVEEHDRFPFGTLDVNLIEDAFRKIFDLGFLGIMLPEKFSGIGQGISAMCMMLGHVAEVDASYSLIILTSSLSQQIILSAGAEEIAEKIYPSANSAREYLVAFRLSPIPLRQQFCPRFHPAAKAIRLPASLIISCWATSRIGLSCRPGPPAARAIPSSW